MKTKFKALTSLLSTARETVSANAQRVARLWHSLNPLRIVLWFQLALLLRRVLRTLHTIYILYVTLHMIIEFYQYVEKAQI